MPELAPLVRVRPASRGSSCGLRSITSPVFCLRVLLLPLIKNSAPARIVNVSSAGQQPIDFGDVMLNRDYSGAQAYCQSKLAQIMFTIDLWQLRSRVLVSRSRPFTPPLTWIRPWCGELA